MKANKLFKNAKLIEGEKVKVLLEVSLDFNGVSRPVKLDEDYNPVKENIIIELKMASKKFNIKISS